ncbi:MAG TPA: nuclear transport factor 2 family protein [Rhizomicrobium sp.]|nr:nuclear transport factor 2 family protein [Rhizomicrobium sp.]
MTLDEMTCKLECHDLIVRYFTIIDTGPRSNIKDVFSEDGRIMTLGGDGGVDPVAAFNGLSPEFVPIHATSNILVTPTGPDTAVGEAYVTAFNMFGKVDDILPRKMPPTPNRIGKILFEFRKTPVGWRIYRFKSGHRFVDDGLT